MLRIGPIGDCLCGGILTLFLARLVQVVWVVEDGEEVRRGMEFGTLKGVNTTTTTTTGFGFMFRRMTWWWWCVSMDDCANGILDSQIRIYDLGCMYAQTSLRICMSACKHLCVCMHVRACMYVCMCMCVCVYVCMYGCSHVYAFVDVLGKKILKRTHMNTRTRACIHTYTQATCIHTHVYMYRKEKLYSHSKQWELCLTLV